MAHDCSTCGLGNCISRNLTGGVCQRDLPAGVTVSPGVTPNESIIDELREEHGIMSFTVPCPCCCDAHSMTGIPDPACPYCNGDGGIQYGIDEAVFV